MLPRIEIPSAPPSSAPVSEIPDAAPARSGGADPTMSSVVSPKTGARPSEMTTERDHDDREPVRRRRPGSAAPSPTAATREARRHEVRRAGRRGTIRGAAFEPTMKPIADGTDQRPASSGDRPRTSCRYWATNRK